MNQREMEVVLRGRVYASHTDLGMQAVREMCNLHIEKVKERLLTCAPPAMAGLQGEALAYATVLKWMSEPLMQKTTVDNQ